MRERFVMPPAQEAEYLAHLDMASLEQLRLARHLQRAAGTVPGGQDDFKPAPVYLRQAVAISRNMEMANTAVALITDALVYSTNRVD